MNYEDRTTWRPPSAPAQPDFGTTAVPITLGSGAGDTVQDIGGGSSGRSNDKITLGDGTGDSVSGIFSGAKACRNLP